MEDLLHAYVSIWPTAWVLDTARYLIAALEHIQTHYGSVPAFAVQRLSMTETMIETMAGAMVKRPMISSSWITTLSD